MTRRSPAKALSLVLAFALLLAPAALHAGIPADARWHITIDVQQLLDSEIGQHMLAHRDVSADDARISRFTERFGFNPLLDVDQITLFNDTYDEGRGTAILRGSFDPDALVQQAAKAPGYQQIQVAGHDAHQMTFTDRNGEQTAYLYVSADAAAVSSSEFGLEAALGLLAEVQPALPVGTFLQLDAFELDQLPKHSQILQHVDAISLTVGEEAGVLFTQHVVTLATAEYAQQAKNMLEGARAFLALRQGQDAPLVKLLKNTLIEVDKDQLIVDWSYDVQDLLDIARQHLR